MSLQPEREAMQLQLAEAAPSPPPPPPSSPAPLSTSASVLPSLPLPFTPLAPPRPAGSPRSGSDCSSFLPPDFNEHRYHLSLLLFDWDWYCSLCSSRTAALTLSASDWAEAVLADRLVLERLDYRFVLSLYHGSSRIHNFPVHRQQRKDREAASPSSASASPQPTAAPLTVTALDLTAASSATAAVSSLHVLCCCSSKLSRCFVLINADTGTAAALSRFVSLVSDIGLSSRSDLWLDVPDAARTQAQMRLWEEQRQLTMEEERRQQHNAAEQADDDRDGAAAAAIDSDDDADLEPLRNGRHAALLGLPSSPSSAFRAVASRSPSPTPPSAISGLRGSRSSLSVPYSSTRSSMLGGLKNVGNSCLSMEHELLTDSGWMDFRQIARCVGWQQRKRLRSCSASVVSSVLQLPPHSSFSAPQLATLDAGSQTLQFRPLSALILNCGRQQTVVVDSPSCGLHFEVTTDHDVYVVEAEQDGFVSSSSPPPPPSRFRKLKAACLLRSPRQLWRFQSAAAAGVAEQPGGELDAVCPGLPLRSAEQRAAFFSFFGLWLRRGGVERVGGSDNCCLTFSGLRDDDRRLLTKSLSTLCWHSTASADSLQLTGDDGLRVARWFWEQYGDSSSASSPWCRQRLPERLIRSLAAQEARALLAALTVEAPPCKSAVLFTADAMLREQLIRIAIIAGCSALAVRCSGGWRVDCTTELSSAMPVVDAACIKTSFTSRSWCVDVPPHHLILVRRRLRGGPSPHSRAVWLGNCFPETDTRLLTDRGLLFLRDVEAAMTVEAAPPLLFACYNPSTQQLQYEPGLLLIKPAQRRSLVNFTQRDEAKRWTAESEAYGSADDDRHSSHSHMSLRVTADHDMFVQLGMARRAQAGCAWTLRGGSESAFRKVKAGSLLSDCACPSQQQDCAHRRARLRMLASAARGVHRPAHCTEELTSRLTSALGLSSPEQADVFLSLFGFWLARGCIGCATARGGQRCLLFVAAKEQQQACWVKKRLQRLGLKPDSDFVACGSSNGVGLLSVLRPSWVDFFSDEKPKSSGSAPATPAAVEAECEYEDEELWEALHEADVDCVSSRCGSSLWRWLLARCDRKQLRLMIDGLWRAGGCNEDGQHIILTSSVRFRDEVVHALLNAGFTATFQLQPRAGRQCSIGSTGPPHVAAADMWRVCYDDDSDACQPVLQRQRDVRTEQYDGRVWCVTVSTGLIVAQRAWQDASGRVTKSSRPVVVGNCYMNAILQALLSIPSFTALLTSPSLLSSPSPLLPAAGSVAPSSAASLPAPLPIDSFYLSLVHLSLQMRESHHGVLDIQRLKDAIGGRYARFAGNSQQDAHEFLSECLNYLHDDIVGCLNAGGAAAGLLAAQTETDDVEAAGDDSATGSGVSRSASPLPLELSQARSPSPFPTPVSSSYLSSPSSPLPLPLLLLSHRLSPIHQTFHFSIEYTLRCTNAGCNYTRRNSQSFYDLSLDIPDPPPTASAAAASSASPVLAPHSSSASPSPDHSPTLSPPLSPLPPSSPPLPPLILTPPQLPTALPPLSVPAARSASPSEFITSAGGSSSSSQPARRRHKWSGPASSSLSSLLSTFFSSRTIECKCSHCGNTAVHMSSRLMQMPRVLVLHLKRFLPNISKGSYDKRADRVRVDREVDLSFACGDAALEAEQPAAPAEARAGGSAQESSGADAAAEEEAAAAAEPQREDVAMDETMEEERLDAFAAPSPPRAAGRQSTRLSDEIDLTLSDDSDNSSASSSSPSAAKKHKGDSALPSPSSPRAQPGKRRARDGPRATADIRVTRAMKRKSNAAAITARPSSPAPPLPPPAPLPAIAPARPTPVYALSSIVQHRGSVAYAGHYVTDIVRAGPVWSRYDDQFVKEISAEHSLRHAESDGYIFFFVREADAAAADVQARRGGRGGTA